MAISKVGEYAFYNHPNIERVTVSAPIIEQNAFENASKLNTVDLTSSAAVNIGSSAFSGCSNLTHMVVRSSARSSMQSNSIDGTKIQSGDGGIYVPANLLDSYKATAPWSSFAANIFPIDEYPRTNFDTIQDSWSTILSNVSYATAYAVKGTKTIELTDGTKIKMDLAAIDTDVKSDESGTAKMTWICHGIPYMHRMNATANSSGGWADSEMRSWLISDILPLIPQGIRSHIVSVKKTYRTKSPNDETLTSNDEIWIPSYKEVGFTDASYIESDGIVYSGLFGSNVERIKHNTSNSAGSWWFRSAMNTDRFRVAFLNGSESGSNANNEVGVVFGFCTD